VRNDREFWVEWVFSPGESPEDEAIVEVRHAVTPAHALQNAREALNDMRQQIAQGIYYLDEDEVVGARGVSGYVESHIEVPFRWDASGTSPRIMVGYIEGTFASGTIDGVVTQAALAYLAEYERQLGDIPELDGNRWMLIN
jgi:hypothetical protein